MSTLKIRCNCGEPIDLVGANIRCDFCCAPFPSWDYPARSFPMPGMPLGGSNGGWATCETCHSAIEAEDWSTVADRAVASFPYSTPGAKEYMLKLHAAFRENRLGPATRLEAEKIWH